MKWFIDRSAVLWPQATRRFRGIHMALAFACAAACGTWARAQEASTEGLEPLVQILSQSTDSQLQCDILKGVSAALSGRRSVPMPKGWSEVETKLSKSANGEVKSLTQTLSLTFGSAQALGALRSTLSDPGIPARTRNAALEALKGTRDPELPSILLGLLSDPELRGPSVRALAAYDHPGTSKALLGVYPVLLAEEKRDVLNTLASRAASAKDLLGAVAGEAIAKSQLTADIIRQLRSLKNPEVEAALAKVWGVVRESSADKKAVIERTRQIYRRGGSQPGDASRGRAVFARICQQCHVLFDTGGKVGPDLTGSNRSDLDYILQNMVDPNAVIPNEYRTSTIETKDDRVLTGIVKEQNEISLTVLTANEALVVPRNEVKSVQLSELSMMPEELLSNLPEQEVRDLIYYLSRPGQVPLPTSEK